ncbi:MAG: zf-HC2 domain-containing protein [Gemmatimonadota bacterium]
MTAQVDCERALALLVDFLKHELPADVATAVEQHLEACRPCEQHARFEAKFVLVISQRLREESCPARLRAQILNALNHEDLSG